ncbi:Qat anti-phage system QueC-like protein QatC [Uliginosibacterium sediminicola]|uniref:Qat anti-phage system QueC-like protein QatC n=1 Tax=Uliginosibacterium sediminicola TaxID=2024550 RepID=A0ABU9YTG4_9RHOO
MTKIICTTANYIPVNLRDGERAFSFFKSAKRDGVGTIANSWRGSLKRKGFRPSPQVWDFVQFCLAVCAADLASLRRSSADGWTRKIELTVGLHEPLRWTPWKGHIENMLKVLTGDYWTVYFVEGGAPPPDGKDKEHDRDCICLLSGGLDSLIGGINLVADGRKPMFVSQLAHEDSPRQKHYAEILGGAATHQQWSHGISFKGLREPSTRARSLAFYAFAVLAASRIPGTPAQVFVPENGFICVNPPLVPGRVASLSTRTTHPLFIELLQKLLTGLDIAVALELPYRYKTKGQMLVECRNQALIRQWAANSTSCGRFRTYNRKHCGRCVPCMIRKAAFLAWDPSADTTKYVYDSLAGSDKMSGPDDPMAAALAVLSAEERGLDSFLGGTLVFASPAERPAYRQVLQAGLAELAALLKRDGLL